MRKGVSFHAVPDFLRTRKVPVRDKVVDTEDWLVSESLRITVVIITEVKLLFVQVGFSKYGE